MAAPGIGGQGHSFQNETSSGAETGSITIGGLSFGRSQSSMTDVAKYAVIGGLALFGLSLYLKKGKK